MSSEPGTEASQEFEDRPRLVAVELGEWPGLGGTVGFDVGERITVLVGKNGAGKSLIMEGLKEAADCMLHGAGTASSLRFFRCDVMGARRTQFTYEFKIAEEIEDELDEELEPTGKQSREVLWSERCQIRGESDYLWLVKDGQLNIPGKSTRDIVSNEGLVATVASKIRRHSDIPEQAQQLADLFNGLDSVAAGIPRGSLSRQAVLLQRIKVGGRYRWEPVVNPDNPTNFLALKLLWMHLGMRQGTETFEEFVDILRQLEIAREVEIHRYDDTPQNEDSFAAVYFDGVNLGLCSDGTQRIAQIIVQLLSPRTRCLLIEEPETAVHPSLLSRLLSIIESYSHDRQIIIATHSPQIVDWCKPEDLRLVERSEGQTRVRKLDEKELGRVHDYLTHDGTLSDYVYRQSSE